VTKANAQYWTTISTQYASIAADLQSLNAHRYAHNITGGNQEFIEALSFHHYLETQSLISYDDARARIAAMSGDAGAVPLTPEDYILGICDMTGELMRFSVTSMATNGALPAGRPKFERKAKAEDEGTEGADRMDVDEQQQAAVPASESQKARTVLDDLRAIRLQLEMFEAPGGAKFASELETKKMPVMRECVDKVEKALYGLTVRGSERPKGWMPDMSSDRRAEVETY
jgi:predicted translin family RNA/ssDNA-binding protein